MKSFVDTALLSETVAHRQALTLMSTSILLASTRTGMLGQNWRSLSYHLQVVLPPCLLGVALTGKRLLMKATSDSSVLAGRYSCWVLIQDAGATHSNSSEAPLSITTGCERPQLVMAAAMKAGPRGPELASYWLVCVLWAAWAPMKLCWLTETKQTVDLEQLPTKRLQCLNFRRLPGDASSHLAAVKAKACLQLACPDSCRSPYG